MGFFSGILGSAIGGLSSLLGNSISANKNASESRDYLNHSLGQQYGYWQKGTLSNWSLQRKSLEKAGYNPMLALSGGAAHAFSPNSPSASSQFSPPDFSGSARQGADLMRDIQLGYKLENEQRAAEIDLTKAQADKARTEKYNNVRSELVRGIVDTVNGKNDNDSVKAVKRIYKAVKPLFSGSVGRSTKLDLKQPATLHHSAQRAFRFFDSTMKNARRSQVSFGQRVKRKFEGYWNKAVDWFGRNVFGL